MKQPIIAPKHVGLILDGNRRWARQRGLPTLEGHSRGYDNLKVITKHAINSGISYVSAYIFSTENWQRAPKEVKYLMELAHRILTKDVIELDQENIRVVWLGSRDRLSRKLLAAIRKAEEKTKDNTRGTLALCFNYGGQQEILDAVKKIVHHDIGLKNITTEVLENALYVPEVPSVDLLIRTSGEKRVSGFMLYRAAYAELYFSDKYWPDFGVLDFDNALAEYAERERRLGK
ncbi:di-trans,poly-cis-decaprenylcistransferase [Candidatus Saccharibacteria bacterium]|nr:di-trans,poly-cis-decaprenylcistransferase [Candidatus Saccharibacteria bacterium]